MTGTPIQNHLGELYSLFTFVHPERFADKITAREEFVERYKNDAKLPELRKILSQYLIRRTKDVVCKELPSCDQVIIYHNITELQKKLYLDIIARDHGLLGPDYFHVFENLEHGRSVTDESGLGFGGLGIT
ncbi:hypothetical protein OSTOST_14775 [Ostertagia ostertagi]